MHVRIYPKVTDRLWVMKFNLHLHPHLRASGDSARVRGTSVGSEWVWIGGEGGEFGGVGRRGV